MADPDTGAGTGRTTQQPALTIVVHADGKASVGGVPVTVPERADIAAVRAAAMTAATSLVARTGRSMRPSHTSPTDRPGL